jgi:uncharacterized protein (UPF0332 family)
MESSNAFFTKALQELATAEIAFERGDYNSTANRAYFAAFHSAIAVLGLDGIKSVTNEHKWVQTTFSMHCIRQRKLFPSTFAAMLFEMMTLRHKADYDVSSVSKKEAMQQLKKAQQFCSTLHQKAESWT